MTFDLVVTSDEHSMDSNTVTKTYAFDGDRLKVGESYSGAIGGPPKHTSGTISRAKSDPLANAAHAQGLDADLTTKLPLVTDQGTNLTVDGTITVDGKPGKTHLEGAYQAVSALDRYQQITTLLGRMEMMIEH
jgi:hypothetical protein